jgi:hypothetical protein
MAAMDEDPRDLTRDELIAEVLKPKTAASGPPRTRMPTEISRGLTTARGFAGRRTGLQSLPLPCLPKNLCQSQGWQLTNQYTTNQDPSGVARCLAAKLAWR